MTTSDIQHAISNADPIVVQTDPVSAAWQFYRQGRRSAAKLACRDALAADGACGDALHLLGIMASEQGHCEQAAEQLSRSPRALPKVTLNPAIESIFDFRFHDFTVDEYDPHPHIKAPISV